MSAESALVENPFFVLGCAVTASPAEVERAAAKLLGLLEVGASAAKEYATPLGPRPRTPDLVRRAAAELRDPEKRLVHEIWARAEAKPQGAAADGDDTLRSFPEALALLGWNTRTRAPR